MSRRATRRHPPSQRKAGGAPARSMPRAGDTAHREASASRGIRGLLYPQWARDIVSELRRVIWPSGEETRSLTIVVIVVAATVGVVLGVIDFAFAWLAEQLLF